jgi:hypothetical protein
MSTPPRLNQLECPDCHALTWIIDADYRSRGEPDVPREQRNYPCPACQHVGLGWALKQQSPPEFLLQPHELYPMTQEAFDYWFAILRHHFPKHRLLLEGGTTFRPFLPEQFAARRAEHEAAHPVCQLRDQDGARRADPSVADVVDWVAMMNDGDVLVLQRRDGGTLKWQRRGPSFAGECCDPTGAQQAHASGISSEVVNSISANYLDGEVARVHQQLRGLAAGQ